jgi:hypothetical protein
MARHRKAGRRQKPGPRTEDGRLSRAYKFLELRDLGTREFQNKRQYLVNGADPALAALCRCADQRDHFRLVRGRAAVMVHAHAA